MAYSGLARLYFDTGEFDKSLHWAKEVALAYYESRGVRSRHLAWHYEHLGLTEDADYWVADALGHTPQPAQRFFSKARQFQYVATWQEYEQRSTSFVQHSAPI